MFRPATRCSPTWCRRRLTGGPTGSNGRWTTSARSAARCSPSPWSPSSAYAARCCCRSSPACSPPPRSSTRSAAPRGRNAAIGSRCVSESARYCAASWAALLAAVTAFEVGNVAATLLILRATELRTPGDGATRAAQVALLLYTGYNLAATLASFPAGRLADRLGPRGPVRVLAAGVALFAAAYLGFAVAGPGLLALALPFLAAGVAIGCVETAEHAAVAALAPTDLRGSAFGLLATIQAAGNLAASTIAGLLWTLASPRVAFAYLTGWMLLALAGLLTRAHST